MLHFNAHHYDPHTVLGLHQLDTTNKVIRLWRPGAHSVYLEVFGEIVTANRVTEEGLFDYLVPNHTTLQDYRLYHRSGLLAHDPYAFVPTIGEIDQYLFARGVHYEIYHILGAQLIEQAGIKGVRFAIWAPFVKSVALVADFNYFDGRVNPMRSLGRSGIWELFIPGLQIGEKYKFEIKSQAGESLIKVDPYAFYTEMRPAHASIVYDVEDFEWQDTAWMEKRQHQANQPQPMTIYEVHLGSWRKNGAHFKNYRDIALELAHYCQEMGFTHVELMPLQEHPLDESWGYQVTGFYAVTSRFGTPQDFQWFVNHLHQSGIGVILDWVPGHFPMDSFALGRFTGVALYEHIDDRQGIHPHWNTYIFNLGRHEVSNFLIANALYWLKVMHIDGLRVDAVASMLYLDYGREAGEWIPNRYGSHENLEAIEFFRHLNSIIKQHCPGVSVIAEESTSFGGVTHPIEWGGLGFDLKWNMGWMNDTLRYMEKDAIYRKYHQSDLTFGLLYAFSEKYALVLSHDEVVHGKKSLLSKMPGDVWQKFANLRLLLSYMICQPGKKLLFMGAEIAQWNEWYCKAELEWFLLNFPLHQAIQHLVKDLNHFYLNQPCLWTQDFDPSNFEWIDFADHQNSVISYFRKSGTQRLLCVHNFTPQFHREYLLYTTNIWTIQEIFSTDHLSYGGSGQLNNDPQVLFNEQGQPYAIKIQLAPLATQLFQV